MDDFVTWLEEPARPIPAMRRLTGAEPFNEQSMPCDLEAQSSERELFVECRFDLDESDLDDFFQLLRGASPRIAVRARIGNRPDIDIERTVGFVNDVHHPANSINQMPSQRKP